MTQQTNLTNFAKAVGSDIKEIKQAQATVKTELQSEIQTAVANVKTEILGEGVPEAFDTLKEISDAVQNGNSSVGAEVTAKLGEHSTKIQELETKQQELDNIDLLSVYTAAKGE